MLFRIFDAVLFLLSVVYLHPHRQSDPHASVTRPGNELHKTMKELSSVVASSHYFALAQHVPGQQEKVQLVTKGLLYKRQSLHNPDCISYIVHRFRSQRTGI